MAVPRPCVDCFDKVEQKRHLNYNTRPGMIFRFAASVSLPIQGKIERVLCLARFSILGLPLSLAHILSSHESSPLKTAEIHLRIQQYGVLAPHDIALQEYSWPSTLALASIVRSGQLPDGHVSKILFHI